MPKLAESSYLPGILSSADFNYYIGIDQFANVTHYKKTTINYF